MASILSTPNTDPVTPSSTLNEKQIALCMGWSAAELVGDMTSLYRKKRSICQKKKTEYVHCTSTPPYKIGRSLSLTDEKRRDHAGLSDSKELWFRYQNILRLSSELKISTKESFEDAFLDEILEFPSDPSEQRWQTIFHSIENWNNRVMVELAARDPLTAKAFQVGKQLAELTLTLPRTFDDLCQKHVKHTNTQRGIKHLNIDAYTFLRGLEISKIVTLIRDLRELQDFLPEASFSAVASGLSAWEIHGRIVRRDGKLKLLQLPRLPGLRYTLARFRLLRCLKPKWPKHHNELLSLDEEGLMILTNWRRQCEVWRGVVFQTRRPDRLLKSSDWFTIDFVSRLVFALEIVVIAILLTLTGLAIAFYAAPGVKDLASVAYGNSKFELSNLGQALTLGPLLTAIGEVVTNLRKMGDRITDIKKRVRSSLIAQAIHKEAVHIWNQPLQTKISKATFK